MWLCLEGRHSLVLFVVLTNSTNIFFCRNCENKQKKIFQSQFLLFWLFFFSSLPHLLIFHLIFVATPFATGSVRAEAETSACVEINASHSVRCPPAKREEVCTHPWVIIRFCRYSNKKLKVGLVVKIKNVA